MTTPAPALTPSLVHEPAGSIVSGSGQPSVRFGSRLDASSEQFEEELQSRLGSDLPLGQTHRYLKETSREFRLLQLRDDEGKASFQAAVYVSRSRLYRGFAQATVPRMGPALNGIEEQRGIRTLRRLCKEAGDLMTLRLQPTRLVKRELLDFESRARREDFHSVDPIDTTRTLLFDLRPSPDELLTGMKKHTRARFKHKSRENVILRPIADAAFISRCREAEHAAHARTRGSQPNFDFETFFAIARKHPERAFAHGLFLKSKPDVLMAFVTGIRHGKLAEYTSAGSFHDPELRAVPFNSFLLWELILWARANGAEQLDLGGVTDGGPEDPLAGISEFKRYLSDHEIEIGREMMTVLQPARYELFRAAQALIKQVRRLKP